MASFNIFTQDAFSMVELTDFVNKQDYKPSLLRDMGIFEPQPVRTRTLMLEKKDGSISLIPASKVGDSLDQNDKKKRDVRHLDTIRLAKGDRIMADEIQNIRAEGEEAELKEVQREVTMRMAELETDLELTEENLMLGAVQGIVLDADGSTVIQNFFTLWGVSQPAEVDFDLDNATPASGALKKVCRGIVRSMSTAGKGAFTSSTEVIGLCGDAFFDDLVAHPEVVGQNNYIESINLSNTYGAYGAIKFGDITFINYRGTDDGSTVAIGTDSIKFFPKGARGVFKHATSPAEFMPYVNTLGQERYAMVLPDEKREAFVDVEIYSYPMMYCTRPEMLLRGKRT